MSDLRHARHSLWVAILWFGVSLITATQVVVGMAAQLVHRILHNSRGMVGLLLCHSVSALAHAAISISASRGLEKSSGSCGRCAGSGYRSRSVVRVFRVG